jgi:hypothetical protein
MIRALDAIAVDNLAHAQRRKTVRTAVLDRRDTAVGLAIEHDRLAHDRARQELRLGEAVRPRRRVPGIADIRPGDQILSQP